MGQTATDLILEHAPKRHGWPDPMPSVVLQFDLIIRDSTARIHRPGE
jgi:DNA-binding LacI/PurR family transcriptional regulator